MTQAAHILEQADERPQRSKSTLLRLAPVLGLLLIILLGAFLRFYHLGADSIGNTYYAATVKSMLSSWHNFFYAAFEPGGSVSVDKPPLGFWVQALSASILGVNGFALALPQALAGVLSIPLLYHLVRRHFGTGAGLLAALVLALTPITIATERNNTIDGLLVLVLLLAAWAFLKASETGRLRHLLLGALLLGLGFNIKMLQAFMPLPAFYAVYLLGARRKWWVRLLHLALATLVTLAVSLAWVVAVDLTPAEQRPYVGSSQDNTVLELIIGHNGLARLGLTRPAGSADGPLMGAGRNPPAGVYGIPSPSNRPPLNPGDALPPGGYPAPINPGDNPAPVPPAYPNPTLPGQPLNPPPGQPGAPGAGRMNETGAPGVLRLFQEPLVTEASWLLPLALLGIPLALVALGWSWPLKAQHLGMLLWAGWLLPSLAYFSFTDGLFHRYYLVMLAPALAALVGISVWAVGRLWQRRRLWGWGLLFVLSGFTLGFQLFILRDYPDYAGWLSAVALAAWLVGVILLALSTRTGWRRMLGMSLVTLALLVAPFTWSLLTSLNPYPNVALPTAVISSPGENRLLSIPADQESLTPHRQAILDYTLSRTEPESYLLATESARDAAPFILATGRPVLTFGGFTGSDNLIDLDGFIQMVSDGELRFVLGLPGNKPEIRNYVQHNCTPVDLYGTSGRMGQVGEILYDCGG